MSARKRPGRASIEGLEARVLRHGGAAGTGLLGQYFNNKDFSAPVLSRVDPAVNFAWGSGSPAAAITPDTFSVRWTGQIIPHKSEAYRFHTSSDDGVRLWIDGKLVIDKFVNQQATTHSSAPIVLTAGQPVDVRLDYYDNTGGAVPKLMWSRATTLRA